MAVVKHTNPNDVTTVANAALMRVGLAGTDQASRAEYVVLEDGRAAAPGADVIVRRNICSALWRVASFFSFIPLPGG